MYATLWAIVEQERALVITATAYVERSLEELLASQLVELSKKEHEYLFLVSGPLATFSAKIAVGYAMGLYHKTVRDQLTTIKDLRNAFAHSPLHISFKTKEVQNVAKRLAAEALLDPPVKDQSLTELAQKHPEKAVRLQFVSIAVTLTGLFLQVADENRRDPPERATLERLRALGATWWLPLSSQ